MPSRKSLPAISSSTPASSSSRHPRKAISTSAKRPAIFSNDNTDEIDESTPSRPRRKAARLDKESNDGTVTTVNSINPIEKDHKVVGLGMTTAVEEAQVMDREKELEVWADFASEHYEMVEQLPLELHRNFRLLRELDDGCLLQQENLLVSIRRYIDIRIRRGMRSIASDEKSIVIRHGTENIARHVVDNPSDPISFDENHKTAQQPIKSFDATDIATNAEPIESANSVEMNANTDLNLESADHNEKQTSTHPNVPDIIMDNVEAEAVLSPPDQDQEHDQNVVEGSVDMADPVSAEDAVEAVLDVLTPLPLPSDSEAQNDHGPSVKPIITRTSGKGVGDSLNEPKEESKEKTVPVLNGQSQPILVPSDPVGENGKGSACDSFPKNNENEKDSDQSVAKGDDGVVRMLVNSESRKERLKLLQEISKSSRDLVRNSEEKLAIAVGAYNSIDRHIRSLDAALAAQDASLVLGLRNSTVPSTKVDPSLHINANTAGLSGHGGAQGGEGDGEVIIGMTGAGSAGGSGGRNRDRKKKKKESEQGMIAQKFSEEGMDYNLFADPNEPRYCYCHQVSYGDMVGCDNDDCPIEWFHLGCLGLATAPTGSWYCDECKPAFGLPVGSSHRRGHGRGHGHGHGGGGDKKKSHGPPKGKRRR